MSLWLDQKYIGSISPRLEKFARKGDHTYNFRCPICGDSQTNRNKARGYVFPTKAGLMYKCHNCQASMTIGNLIKQLDPTLYNEYCLERYKNGETGKKPHKEHNYIFKPVTFGSNRTEQFKGIMKKLSDCEESNEAVVYAVSRKIPKDKYEKLYFIDNISKIVSLAPDYEDKIVTDEPRLVLPFYSAENELVGFSCRALRGEKQRYVVIKIRDDLPMIYNMNSIHTNHDIYVTEGPIDSLFLPNAVAVGNSNLKLALQYFDDPILVYDNEPRNKEILKEMKTAIDAGARICIWSKTIQEKDINEMLLAGKTQDEILQSINKNVFRGPAALLEFTSWRMR